MTARKNPTDDVLRTAVLQAALGYASADGFTDRTLTRAGTDAGAGCEMMLHLFPQGPASLVEFFSGQSDGEMERLLAKEKLSEMKVRDRIAALRKAGGHPLSTEYAGVGHNVREWAYTEPALVSWVFSQRRAT